MIQVYLLIILEEFRVGDRNNMGKRSVDKCEEDLCKSFFCDESGMIDEKMLDTILNIAELLVYEDFFQYIEKMYYLIDGKKYYYYFDPFDVLDHKYMVLFNFDNTMTFIIRRINIINGLAHFTCLESEKEFELVYLHYQRKFLMLIKKLYQKYIKLRKQ